MTKKSYQTIHKNENMENTKHIIRIITKIKRYKINPTNTKHININNKKIRTNKA